MPDDARAGDMAPQRGCPAGDPAPPAVPVKSLSHSRSATRSIGSSRPAPKPPEIDKAFTQEYKKPRLNCLEAEALI